MRLSSPSVQRLLNASERDLVASASAVAIKDLSAARLRSKVDRARRLKDKYDALARARGRVGRGKAQPKAARARTDVETMTSKAAVFDEVLTRFTAALDKLERKAARGKAAPTSRAQARAAVSRVRARVARQAGAPADVVDTTAAPAEPDAAVASATARSRNARGARVQQKLAVSHVTRSQGHVGARTQRAQARRDGK